jgi:hypothetical protein
MSNKFFLTKIFFIISVIIERTMQIELINFKLLLDSDQEFKIPQGKCFLLRVNHLYQYFKLEIDSQGLNKLIITNDKLELSTGYPQCIGNSTSCFEHIFPSKIDYVSKYCVLSTYIYGCATEVKENVNSTAIVKASTTLDQTKKCIPFKSSLETECAKLGNKCNDEKVCINKCEYLSCFSSNTDNKEVFNLCIPSGSNENRLSICNSIYPSESVEFKATPCKSKIDYPLKEKLDTESEDNKFLKFIAIVIGILIVILLLSSLFYRVKLKEDGVPPFTPPEYMPGFLFPRPKKEDVFMTKN